MLAALLRAAKTVEENPLAITDIARPFPRKHEVRLRVHCCAVCHTDLHTVEGHIFGASAHIVIQIARYWDCEALQKLKRGKIRGAGVIEVASAARQL